MSCISNFVSTVKVLANLIPLMTLQIGFTIGYLSLRKKPTIVESVLLFGIPIIVIVTALFQPHLSLIGVVVFYSAALWKLSDVSKRLPLGFSESMRIVNVVFGLWLAFMAILIDGLSISTLFYSVNVSAYSYLIYTFRTGSFVPSIFLTLSLLPVFVERIDLSTLHPVFLLLSLVTLLIGRFSDYRKAESYTGTVFRVHRFISLYIVFLIAGITVSLSMSGIVSILDNMDSQAFRISERLADNVYEMYTELGIPLDRIARDLPTPWKIVFIEVSGDNRSDSVRFGDEACFIVEKRYGSVVLRIGVDLPFMSVFTYTMRIVFLNLILFVVVFSGVNRFFYMKWRELMENELERRTNEIVAVNQELVALNEELVSMNEDMEKMYSDLSDLNEKIVTFVNFLRGISLSERIEGIFSKMLDLIRNMVKGNVRGLRIRSNSGGVVISIGAEGYPIEFESGECVLEVFFEEAMKLKEEDEKLLEIISNVAFFIMHAKRSYEELEKREKASSNVLELLDDVITADSKEDVEEKLLNRVIDIFDDAVVVGVGWKENMTDDSLVVRFVKDTVREPRTEILKGKGIMRVALESGEEYIAQDALNDPNFLIVDERSRSAFAVPLKGDRNEAVGVMIIERSRKNAFTDPDLKILRIFARIVAIAIQKIEYFKSLKKTFLETVEALAMAIELKDPYTHGHSRRVADYSVAIARALKLPEDTVERIELAALLHDIGKIGIRGYILNKPTRLTREEFEEIKKHPVLGAELVGRVGALRDIAKIIRHHHENWNGKGYPDGLEDGEIPLESRIIAIADAFDSMTSDRPYRKALNLETALRIIRENERGQWDPNIIPVAVEVLKREYWRIGRKYGGVA